MTPAIEAIDLQFSRGTFSLSLPAWTVLPGQRVALHGASGCGKSTLLDLISGQLLPSSGQLTVAGRQPARMTVAQRRAWRAQQIGFIFQDFPLIDYLSALDNVLLPYRLSAGLKRDAAVVERAGALLSTLGLTDHRRSPARLSQGERQRVAIARALVTQPRLLLADEPTAGLDPTQSQAVLDLLWSLSADHGLTLVLVTHDPALLGRFADRLDVSSHTAQ